VFRSYGPEGGVNPHVAAQVKFNNSPSVFAIVDEYCLEPGCGCRDVTLGFYEVMDNEFEEPHFKILVNVDTWEIKDQRHVNNKRVDEICSHFMNNFCNRNEENDFVFKLLKDRSDRMKKINLTKYLTEGNGSDQSNQSPENAVSFKVGRNDPCPCGSGKKYKKCCGRS